MAERCLGESHAKKLIYSRIKPYSAVFGISQVDDWGVADVIDAVKYGGVGYKRGGEVQEKLRGWNHYFLPNNTMNVKSRRYKNSGFQGHDALNRLFFIVDY